MKTILIQLITIGMFSVFPVIVSAQQPETIKVGKGLKREKPVLLKDIAQEVEYIFLETTDQCRISGPGHHIAANSDNIVVADKAFLRFDRQGRFLNSISGKGKEPGKYTEIAGFDFDSTGETFFIFDRLGKMMQFNLNGDLIREQSVLSGLYASPFGSDNVLNLHSSRMVARSNGYRVVINDLNGTTVCNLLKVNQDTWDHIDNLSVQNTQRYVYRDSATVWEGLCDTVYRISDDFKVTPRYYLDLGRHRLPKVLPISPITPGYRKLIDKYRMPMRIFESDQYIYLETSYQGRTRQHLYNKDTRRSVTLPERTRIVNDFDGGPDFWPIGTTSDGKLYMLFDRVMLKQYWKPNTKNELKYPDRQLDFIRMLEKSSVNDNPVIMLVTPKGN